MLRLFIDVPHLFRGRLLELRQLQRDLRGVNRVDGPLGGRPRNIDLPED
jgi:hypothetical protein